MRLSFFLDMLLASQDEEGHVLILIYSTSIAIHVMDVLAYFYAG